MDEILYPGLQPETLEPDTLTVPADAGLSRRERLRRKLDELLFRYDAFVQRHKPRAKWFLISALTLGAVSTALTVYTVGYAVVVDGQTLGVVADTAQVEAIEHRVESRVGEILGQDYSLADQVRFDWQIVERRNLSTGLSGFEGYLLDQVDEVAQGYVLTVDGTELAVQSGSGDLEALLDSLKAPYVNENTIQAEFTLPVGVSRQYVGVDRFQDDLGEVEALLRSNTKEAVIYTVVKGDTYSTIAHRHDMTVDELMAMNPQASLDRLMIGDQLTVSASVPYLGVRTVDKVQYEEAIPAPVEYVDDASMYQGDTKVLDSGAEGLSLVDARITYLNGTEQEREILNTQELVAPQTKTVARGTKERPKTMAKGYFIWPVSGRLTSRYGGRSLFGSYNFHGGIDIAVPYGTSIKAADGGKVITAGWHSSYGNYIIIDHENGKTTYYAHNSSLLVSVGQRVYQGQVIAKAGSTGNSTGSHCHFEVRVGGVRQNPLNYL